MSFHPYSSEQEKLQRFLNSFATRSFRHTADGDYIAARLACRHELYPQFLWSSQQAIEKYLKAILLYNRVAAPNLGHRIDKALALFLALPLGARLSERTKGFLKLIEDHGQVRYLDLPYTVSGHVLPELDLTVWELRRYCQVLDPERALSLDEKREVEEARQRVEASHEAPRHRFRLAGGMLEKVLDDPKHPSRAPLVWNNPCFGGRVRNVVKSKYHFHMQNPDLSIYPDMLDELGKYVHISHEKEWRTLLEGKVRQPA